MKILLAVDGSKPSLKAVRSFIGHANWYRDKPTVELVTVHLPVPKISGMGAVISGGQIQRYYDREGKASLSKASKLLDAAGIRYSPRILVGPVAESIVRHARLTRCHLIMIGTRGRSAAANLFMGSCATRLVSLSTIPVLLVRT
jgi:nucleotide-binding universal stress UspA family protein